MAQNQPSVKYLKDYQAPAYFIDKTALHFDLYEGYTLVHSKLSLRLNAQSVLSDLVLDGQDLELLSISLNDETLSPEQYSLDDEKLSIAGECLKPLGERFDLSVSTKIYPEKNTCLEGLYRSRTMYCTQCEAEGFRRITYYIDRPDVMSEFETTISAPEGLYNTMLSNGNCIADSTCDGKRTVVWHDPHKKPCYLFALVAGNLSSIEDSFTTCSGREVCLQIYVEEKDLGKCDHAMDSLKRSMRWDEEQYGREYDLDIFMIVAVDDFNMGAMENKGLNIFNTSCVLAHPETTTDQGFQRVEAVVAHEYFHNWTGNRVTCRDWFQLSLKEGFTVYRDSEFSADMNSRAVKRIEDANFLRAHQFVEDAGPMAHAVRPESFIEISNFYTLTIYEKGAEVVRMMANLLGPERFRTASDLYFERHDGQAVTCEDFVCAMEDASGIDLGQFRLWYEQAGTPELHIQDAYDEATQSYQLRVKQSVPDTPGQTNKQPMHIPLKLALLGEAGFYRLQLEDDKAVLEPSELGGEDQLSADNTERVIDVREQEQTFTFKHIAEKPVPSLLRAFSAPVNLHYDYSQDELLRLIARDDDGFSRFNAIQHYYRTLIAEFMQAENQPSPSTQAALDKLLSVLRDLLTQGLINEQEDPALLAYLLPLPAQAFLLEQFKPCDPVALNAAVKALRVHVADKLSDALQQGLDQADTALMQLAKLEQSLSGQAMAWRSLKQVCLSFLAELNQADFADYLAMQYDQANNMTERAAALKALLHMPTAKEAAALRLEAFYTRFESESLVVNMWLQMQATQDTPDALAAVQKLMQHPAFDINNPNKCRSVIGAFCMQNPAGFHRGDGAGYQFLAEQVIRLNALNPQIASRLVGPLSHWRKLDKKHGSLMRKALQQVADAENLSKDVFEVVSKSL